MQDVIREEAKKKIARLVQKKDVFLTDTWNSALFLVLKFFRDKYKRIIIPNQGTKLPPQSVLEDVDMLATLISSEDGLLKPDHIKEEEHALILASSMPGFAVLNDFSKVLPHAKLNDLVIINDATGSIGTEAATIGDFIIGRFTEQPVQIGKGAFIATNHDFKTFYRKYFKVRIGFDEDDLFAALTRLADTRKILLTKAQRIKKELTRYDLVHKFSEGWNVIIRTTPAEKETLITYCHEHNLRYKICPCQERMLEEGISIEVTALDFL